MPLVGPALLVSAAGPDARTVRACLDAELPGWLGSRPASRT
jgi:hypothetical protein